MNLVGYCEEKNQRILVYEYMSHGSLEQRLVGKLLMTTAIMRVHMFHFLSPAR